VARTLWSGAISFGLVNVPVRLVSAVRPQNVRFNQVSVRDGARVKQKRVSAATGEEVAYEDIAKGYEVAPGKYVVITREELEALDPEATRTIEIEDFVDLDEIDPVYFDQPYYLAPYDRSADKPYRLLVLAMERSSKVAIARFVMRSKQYLAAVRAKDGALVISTMNYADEVVPVREVEGIPDEEAVELRDREVVMAEQLIESLAAPFEPERYEDEYRKQVLELIDRKARGEEVVAPAAVAEPTEVVDLMAALEQSIEAANQRREAG
jgi:DNA end-binding protein Ku